MAIFNYGRALLGPWLNCAWWLKTYNLLAALVYLKMGTFPALFSFILVFTKLLLVENSSLACWWDSNCWSLVSEVTTLPTEPPTCIHTRLSLLKIILVGWSIQIDSRHSSTIAKVVRFWIRNLLLESCRFSGKGKFFNNLLKSWYQKCSIKWCMDWIQTTDIWCRTQPPNNHQQCHCPCRLKFY